MEGVENRTAKPLPLVPTWNVNINLKALVCNHLVVTD